MPVDFRISSTRGPVAVLLLLIGVGVTCLVLALPATLSRFFGGCTLGFGVLIVLTHRRLGRQVFDSSRSMPTFVIEFWDRIGREGTQLLYLGTGIILIFEGAFLLIRSLAN